MFMTMQSVADIQMQPTAFDEPINMQDNPRHKGDERLFVQFYKRPVMNNTKSAEQGRPIFDEIDYVRIIVPGSKDILDVEAADNYKARFPNQWQRYEAKQAQTLSGTPLSVWPQMTVGLVAELNALNIFTVEQLANLNDSTVSKIPAGQQMKQRAQAFLEAAQGEAANSKLSMELDKRDQEIAALKAQMQQILEAQAKSAEKPPNAAKKE